MTPIASQASPTPSPPRVPAAFRVGIVGHRPNRLEGADLGALGALFRRILSEVAGEAQACCARSADPGYESARPPVLRVVSPLAEGADRMVAEAGLELGFGLCCPLPFARAEYERDFTGEAALECGSLERFRGLLERARRAGGQHVFELDGDRADAAAAYGAAGRVLINQSDLLLAVWDGLPARGGGGTVQTMREALQLGVPVLWIDARTPHAWALLRTEGEMPRPDGQERGKPADAGAAGWAGIRELVRETLCWPASGPTPGRHHGAADLREEYFAETKPRLNPAFAWKLFRSLVGEGRLRLPAVGVADFERQVAEDWPAAADRSDDEARPETPFEWINRSLRVHFAWADRLADLYGDKYRSAFVLAFPLAAVAVFLALLPVAAAAGAGHASEGLTVGCVVGELFTLGCIFTLIYAGRKCRWHERWMDYRLLAETLRQLRILVPLGGGRLFARLPAHLATYGDPSQSWVFAHMRAVARFTGLPAARVDPAYVRECLGYVRDMVRGQVRFHEMAVRRCERIEHYLHGTAFWLGCLTVAAIILHLIPHLPLPGLHGWHPPAALGGWLTFVCAGFPALGAALAGISNQGEFARVAKRSEAMAARFHQLATEIDRLERAAEQNPTALRLAQVTPFAAQAAQLMVDEVLDWRVVFLDRPPVLPA